MKEFKPTKEQLVQAMDDMEDGKPLTADMRAALNRLNVDLAQAKNVELAHQKQFLEREQFSQAIKNEIQSLMEIESLCQINPMDADIQRKLATLIVKREWEQIWRRNSKS